LIWQSENLYGGIMGFKRWGYDFEGSWTIPSFLESRSGIYVIWCKDGDNWYVLDVGESHDVKDRVLKHDRKDCWEKKCTGVIYYSAMYTPNLQQHGRKEIEQKIRLKASPKCGER
jgi:hypothetical protein